jgi:hypothetical protein
MFQCFLVCALNSCSWSTQGARFVASVVDFILILLVLLVMDKPGSRKITHTLPSPLRVPVPLRELQCLTRFCTVAWKSRAFSNIDENAPLADLCTAGCCRHCMHCSSFSVERRAMPVGLQRLRHIARGTSVPLSPHRNLPERRAVERSHRREMHLKWYENLASFHFLVRPRCRCACLREKSGCPPNIEPLPVSDRPC